MRKVKFKRGTIESLVRDESRPATAVSDARTMDVAKSFAITGEASIIGVS